MASVIAILTPVAAHTGEPDGAIAALQNCSRYRMNELYLWTTASLLLYETSCIQQRVRYPHIPACPGNRRSLWRVPSAAERNVCGVSLGRSVSRASKGEIVCVGTLS